MPSQVAGCPGRSPASAAAARSSPGALALHPGAPRCRPTAHPGSPPRYPCHTEHTGLRDGNPASAQAQAQLTPTHLRKALLYLPPFLDAEGRHAVWFKSNGRRQVRPSQMCSTVLDADGRHRSHCFHGLKHRRGGGAAHLSSCTASSWSGPSYGARPLSCCWCAPLALGLSLGLRHVDTLQATWPLALLGPTDFLGLPGPAALAAEISQCEGVVFQCLQHCKTIVSGQPIADAWVGADGKSISSFPEHPVCQCCRHCCQRANPSRSLAELPKHLSRRDLAQTGQQCRGMMCTLNGTF